MSEYNKYIFDMKNRIFIGNFEGMYKNENIEGFDSWNQSDMRNLAYPISLVILNQYNFSNILDIGCGKGLFTSYLKKHNNNVTGWDISETAIKTAKTKYKDIIFETVDIKKISSIKENYDLVIVKEILSYIKNWKNIIKLISKNSLYFYITLYIPTNPIGYVKNFDELKIEINKYFNILTEVYIATSNQILLLCINKKRDII